MNVSIRYGTETMNRSCSAGTTVGQVLASAAVRAELGFGDNVRALLNGVEQPASALVQDGSQLIVETRANSKAKWNVKCSFRISVGR